jgi:FAD/FMN-containing dehydrogenase
MQLCVDVGGTITGEHGVGIDKRQYMTLVHNNVELDMLTRVKRCFDPDELFNPGKVIPDMDADVDAGVDADVNAEVKAS